MVEGRCHVRLWSSLDNNFGFVFEYPHREKEEGEWRRHTYSGSPAVRWRGVLPALSGWRSSPTLSTGSRRDWSGAGPQMVGSMF